MLNSFVFHLSCLIKWRESVFSKSHERFQVAHPQHAKYLRKKDSGTSPSMGFRKAEIDATRSSSLYFSSPSFMYFKKKGERTRSSSTTITFPNLSVISVIPEMRLFAN